MATAIRIIEQVEIPQPPIVKTETTGIDLALTLAEAQTLQSILGAVGGCPQKSRRRHADSIARALGSVGFVSVCLDYRKNGSICFDNDG